MNRNYAITIARQGTSISRTGIGLTDSLIRQHHWLNQRAVGSSTQSGCIFARQVDQWKNDGQETYGCR